MTDKEILEILGLIRTQGMYSDMDIEGTAIYEAIQLIKLQQAKIDLLENQNELLTNAYDINAKVTQALNDDYMELKHENEQLKKLLNLSLLSINDSHDCKQCTHFNHSAGGCGIGIRNYMECRENNYRYFKWQHIDNLIDNEI